MFFTVFAREVFKIALAIAAIFVYRELLPVMLILSASAFIGFFLDFTVINSFLFRQRLLFQKETIRNIFGVSYVLALIAGVNSFFLLIDIIVLSKIKGEVPVAFYSVAYKFITFSFLFIDGIGMALFPVLVRCYRESTDRFRELSEGIFKYFLILAIPFIATVFFFSRDAIFLVFGSQYAASADILRLLIWVVPFLGGAYFLGKMLFVADMQRYDLLSLIGACGMNLLLNIFFTLRWGYYGTAIATLISVVFLFAMHLYFFRKKVFILNFRKIWAKPLIAGIPFFVLFFWLSKINVFLGFAASTVVYFFLLSALGVVSRKDIIAFAGNHIFRQAAVSGGEK